MRILWTMDFHSLTSKKIGGGVFSTEILVNELLARGNRTCLFAPDPLPRKYPWYIHWVMTGRIFTERVKSAVRGWDPDIIVCQGHMFPYTMRGALGKPCVVVARDHHYRCPMTTKYNHCGGSCARCVGTQAIATFPFFKYHVNLKKKMLVRSNAQIVCSDHLAKDMKNHFPETDPLVVYPPMDLDHIPDRWDPTHVIYMGKGKYKGADIVAKIATRMLNTDVKFLIAGDQDPEHHSIFQSLPNCEVVGFSPRKDIFRKGKILISPVRWNEPFSRMIAESATVGIPSIVSDRGGQLEAMGPGGFAIDDPTDIDRWVSSIDDLFHSTAWWTHLSNEAKDYSRRFNSKDLAQDLERIFEGVISST